MIKKLATIGNSLGLIIDKPILELLDIDKDTELEVKTDGVGLTIRPVRPRHEERVREAGERLMDAHAEALRKLAE